MKHLIAFLFILVSSVPLVAQNFTINNVTLFDGEKVIKNTSVVIENGIISQIGKNIQVRNQQIDGQGKFLMPAMTNSHVHAFSAMNLMQAAQAGVLNVLDMHGVEEYQPQIKALSDSRNYARYFYAGAAATAPEGHGTQYGFPTPTLTIPKEAESFIDDRVKAGADYIKIIVEPWKPTLSHDVVKSLIKETHLKDKVAVVHISKVDDAVKVIKNKADGLAHIWWDKPITEQQLNEVTSEETFFVIPTLLTSHLVIDQIKKAAPDQTFLSNEELNIEVKRLYNAGVPILAGTDPPNANINYGTDLYKELVLLSKSGLSNLDALKSATSYPATFFKLDKIGFIKKGYKADMLLLDKNPITDIQNISTIEAIWKEGRTVKRNE